MSSLTYKLQDANGSCDEYYARVLQLAAEVLDSSLPRLLPELDGYMAYAEERGATLMIEESLVEFLTLGVYWRSHLRYALASPRGGQVVLTWLTTLRYGPTAIKSIVDRVRGLLGTVALGIGRDSTREPTPTVDRLNRLINWLEATGEFRHEVPRLRTWQSYLSRLSIEGAESVLQLALREAQAFESRAEVLLGAFTERVDAARKQYLMDRRWREDYFLCTRHRAEYHLNMVGAEILNRAYNEAFQSTQVRLLLVPTCMCSPGAGGCRAQQGRDGLSCQSCSAQCQVNQLVRLGHDLNYSVQLIRHETEALNTVGTREVGVIGVACVLNLLEGGWKARRLGLAAQCVLLNESSCRAHWHPKGVPTRLNMDRLREIIQADTIRIEM